MISSRQIQIPDQDTNTVMKQIDAGAYHGGLELLDTLHLKGFAA
jgi:hypothetical protein